MKITKIILIFIFVNLTGYCGFSHSTCEGETPPPTEIVTINGNYSVSEYRILSPDKTKGIEYGNLGTQVLYSEYAVVVNMQINNYVNREPSRKYAWLDFFLNPAYACSFSQHYVTDVPLISINITSDKDFDEAHPAGVSLNDYFNIYHLPEREGLENKSISEFITNSPNTPVEFTLYISSPPDTDGFHNFSASFVLANGMTYDIIFSHYLTNVAGEA